MGYACPVCDEPQVDARHLANHVAFTAILRGGAHESWLEETIPDWTDRGPEELGASIAGRAEQIDLEGPESSEAIPPKRPVSPDRAGTGPDRLSDRDRAVIEEARELTRQMHRSGQEEKEEKGDKGEKGEKGEKEGEEKEITEDDEGDEKEKGERNA